jgi:hypothetical protein
MTRPLFSILLFVILLFAGDRAGAWLLQTLMDQSALPIARLYGGKAPTRIVILGNSRAYRHLLVGDMSRDFGRSVENFSNPGAGMRVAQATLLDFIDRYGVPRVVVVELSALTTSAEALSDYRPFVQRSPRLASLIQLEMPQLYYAGQFSHLFNYNSSTFLNALHKAVVPIGDLRLRGSVAPEAVAKWAKEPPPVPPYFQTVEAEAEAFRQILAAREQHGFALRLVLSPVQPVFGHLNQFIPWRDQMKRIVGPYPVWDYGLAHDLKDQEFADPTHMNPAGVANFVCMLRQDGFFDTSPTAPAVGAQSRFCQRPR